MCKIYCLICGEKIKKVYAINRIKHWLWRYFPLGKKLRNIVAIHFWNFSIFFLCDECQMDVE